MLVAMQIGLVRRGFSATGGAENYLRRFAAALAAAGHQPVLITDRPWPPEFVGSYPGHILPAPSPLGFARRVERARADWGLDLLFSLERLLACDCYRAGDGVHRAWLGYRAAGGSTLAAWWRALRPAHRQLLALERQVFAPAHTRAVIVNSQLVAGEITGHFGYPADRIHLVRNGVPAAPDEPAVARLRASCRARLEIDPHRLVVLLAGSGWARKGLRHALRAIADSRVAAPLLLVAGRGNPPAAYRRSPRLRFLGPVKDMAALYAAADLFLLPTLYDPFSNASLEALSFGLPLITTRRNGAAELVAPGVHGEVIERPDDHQALARAIEAWAPPDRRHAARATIRAMAAPFTPAANVAGTLAILNSLA